MTAAQQLLLLHLERAEVLSRVEARRLDRCQQVALIAAREAWADAGAPDVDPTRLGVVVGTGIGGIWTTLDQWDVVRERGARRCCGAAIRPQGTGPAGP